MAYFLYFFISASYLVLSLAANSLYLSLVSHFPHCAPSSLPTSGTFQSGWALRILGRSSLAKNIKADSGRFGALGSLAFLTFFFVSFAALAGLAALATLPFATFFNGDFFSAFFPAAFLAGDFLAGDLAAFFAGALAAAFFAGLFATFLTGLLALATAFFATFGILFIFKALT